MAQLAVASLCGRLLHVISGPQSTLSIFHNCGKEEGPALPSVGCSSNRAWKSSKKFRFIRSHLGHLHLPASTSQPAAVPSLCTQQTPSKTTKIVSPEFLASCNCVGYDVPGRGHHTEGTSEEAAAPGPPHWCLPLALSV